ncbi:MAG: hypothetical protein WBN89_01495 [Prochlorococcaceae cyanobacterium]
MPSPRLASASFAGFAVESRLFPIVLHDHTKAGIRWRVSIHPELCAEGTVVVRFLKRGRPGRILECSCQQSIFRVREMPEALPATLLVRGVMPL